MTRETEDDERTRSRRATPEFLLGIVDESARRDDTYSLTFLASKIRHCLP